MSKNLNETIAHAIHSLTLNELRKFNPDAEIDNGVPVVNPRLNDPTTNVRVVPNAPEEAIGELIYPRRGLGNGLVFCLPVDVHNVLWGGRSDV